MSVYAYRHNENKDIYLIRTVVDDNGNTKFGITRDPYLALYAYSLDKDTYDYLVSNATDEEVGYSEEKSFDIDGYSGVLYKPIKLRIKDFEKIEFKESDD